jgi:hypothetical protein
LEGKPVDNYFALKTQNSFAVSCGAWLPAGKRQPQALDEALTIVRMLSIISML